MCWFLLGLPVFFFSSRRRHTSCSRDWSSDVCSSDLAADEQRSAHVETEPVAEWAEDSERVAGCELGERTCARADRVDQKRELARSRDAEAHRARQHAAGRLEHEELSRDAWIERAARDAQQRVRTDRLDRDDATTLAPHASPAATASTPRAPSRLHRPRRAQRRAW